MTRSETLVRLALPALVAGALFAGASTLFVRLSDLGPIASAFHRAFLAIPILYILMRIELRGRSIPSFPNERDSRVLLILAGAFFAGDLFFWHLGIMNTTVANVTLLATLSPIYVTIILWLVFKERPSLGFVLGTAAAVIGAGFLIGDSLAFNPDRLWGDIYGVITGLFLAAYMVCVGRLRLHTPIGTATLMFWSSVVTAAILFPLAAIIEGDVVSGSLTGWLILLTLALVSHVGGQGLIAYAMAHLATAFAALALLIEVVAAAALGWLFLGETLGFWQWLGGVVVLLGIVVARRATR